VSGCYTVDGANGLYVGTVSVPFTEFIVSKDKLKLPFRYLLPW